MAVSGENKREALLATGWSIAIVSHVAVSSLVSPSSARNRSSRCYPVGRLDKNSHGLILLTNDGRLPNASLRSEMKKDKVYEVAVHRDLTSEDLRRLASGVTITTIAQRKTKRVTLTAPTKPCKVEQLRRKKFRIVLNEGRNRQIRKMCNALGMEVINLKRVSFMGIGLGRLREGEWDFLNDAEIAAVRDTILARDENKSSRP